MSAEIVEVTGNVVICRVRGELRYAEFAAVQRKVAEIIQAAGKVRFMVIAENFQGWEESEGWGDMSFQLEHDGDIERMAIVGEERWEELVNAFVNRDMREFPIEYFPPTGLAQARAWIAEG